ncbi:MAG: hypothetical protein AAFV87_07870, partial [Pseudomonadota bacterium]
MKDNYVGSGVPAIKLRRPSQPSFCRCSNAAEFGNPGIDAKILVQFGLFIERTFARAACACENRMPIPLPAAKLPEKDKGNPMIRTPYL